MKIGQKVKIKGFIQRNNGKWKPVTTRPSDAIWIGWRTLSNGKVYYSKAWDDPTTYHPEEYFRAELVVFHERQKPVFVLPDQVQS